MSAKKGRLIMPPEKKDAEKLFDEAISDLKSVHDKEDVSAGDKKKISGAAELLDSLQFEKLGKRQCKVGSTIPE